MVPDFHSGTQCRSYYAQVRLMNPTSNRKSRNFEGFDLSSAERLRFATSFVSSRTFLFFAAIMVLLCLVLPNLWRHYGDLITDPLIAGITGASPGEHEKWRSLFVIAVILPWVLMYGSAFLTIYLFSRPFVRRSRMIMRQMGFPICTMCGHNLTGLADDPKTVNCPECGASIANMPALGTRRK